MSEATLPKLLAESAEVARRCNAHPHLVAALKDAREKLTLYFDNVCDSTGAGEYVGGVPYPVLMARIDAALKQATE